MIFGTLTNLAPRDMLKDAEQFDPLSAAVFLPQTTQGQK